MGAAVLGGDGTATTGGTYLNLEPGTTTADVKSGFGEAKYDRLVALKDTWDPTNVFRLEPQHRAVRLGARAGGATAAAGSAGQEA